MKGWKAGNMAAIWALGMGIVGLLPGAAMGWAGFAHEVHWVAVAITGAVVGAGIGAVVGGIIGLFAQAIDPRNQRDERSSDDPPPS